MNTLVRNLTTAASSEPPDFRGAMRQLTGAVSVITVGRGDDISGMTITSVTSLAADPPSLLVCINRSASSWPLFERTGAFAVNVLQAHQQPIADRFAGKDGRTGRDRFAGADWTTLVTGVPVLADALAALDCSIEEVIERHSHAIVIGRVVATRLAPADTALAYWRGDYLSLDHGEDALRIADLGLPQSGLRARRAT